MNARLGISMVLAVIMVMLVKAAPFVDNRITREEDTANELIMVHSIWRHGSRAPIRLFKNDPNREEDWPGGLGNLLVAGMLDCFELGSRLRNRYHNFLRPSYRHSEIYIRSSDTNRTLRSAQSNLIGLYQNAQRGIDYPDVPGWPDGFVPVPIHSIARSEDDALFGYTVDNCPRFRKAWTMMTESSEYKNLLHIYKDVIKRTEIVTGDPVDMSKRDGAYYVVDEHFINKRAHKPLTPGFTETLYRDLKDLSDEAIAFQFGFRLKKNNGVNLGLEMAIGSGSTLLWEIINRMKAKARCYEQQSNGNQTSDCAWIEKLKYYGYSAHDNTITSLFATLGFPQTNWNKVGYPAYSSCLVFELRRNIDTKEFNIKLFYIVADEQEMDLTGDVSGCEQSCTLNEFARRSEAYRVKNRTEFCNSEPGVY